MICWLAQILAIEVLKAALRLRLLASNHETLQTNGEKLVSLRDPAVVVMYSSKPFTLSTCLRAQEMDKTTCTWDSYIHFCDGRRRREQQQRRAAGLPEAERVLVFTGGRSGIQLRVPASYTGAAHADVLRQQQLREKQLQQSLQYLRIGEVLHILRPVVYAALKYTISTQKTSSPRSSDQQRREEISAAAASPTSRDWIPWIVSLLMELAALYCTAMAIALAQGTKSSSSSTRTRAPHAADASQAHPFERELERRKWLLAWYLLRSPLFETGVRPLLQTALRIFGSTPLLGGLFRYITNLPEYLHRHHFYTAGSS